ncbi:ABC transporter ATP-binding protein [Planctomycetota bacterium]|nr:ABC transporter ATP-binding protein [Planctomycetota bacterium]
MIAQLELPGAPRAAAPPPRPAIPAHLALPLPLGPHLAGTGLRFVAHVATGPFRWWLLSLVTLEALSATCGILLPLALSRIITAVTSGGAATVTALAVPLGLFASLCLGELVAGRVAGVIQWKMAPRQRQLVARSLFRYVQRHSHRFLSDSFAGALGHRVGEVSQGVNQVLFAVINEFWPIAIVIVVANGLLLATHHWLGLFTTVWSAAFIGLSWWFSSRALPLAQAASHARSHTAGQIVDTVSNHATVRLFSGLDHECDRLDRRYAEELVPIRRANHALEQVRLFQFTASAVLKAGVVVLAVHLWSQGSITVGQFVLAVSLSLLVIAEVRNLGRRFIDVSEYLGNVSSGTRALLRPHDLTDREGAKSLPEARGAVAFDQIDFRYEHGVEVFRGLSVAIPAGQRVGLVGVSGSGKSTFVSLLLRLYDPQGGRITIDGHDLRDLTQDSLRRQVGLIPQDPMMFHRSLRENIRYGRPEADDTAVAAAAERAHAADFIASIPGGYDALVGERGVKLSGGQRQRIAIARVILKDAPLLILDEATASLDSLTEHAIQEALDDVMAGKTVIVIAHRLSTIAHLDRILVFAGGQIIEDGSHDELLARGGAYHALWSRQSGGMLPDDGPSPVSAAGG